MNQEKKWISHHYMGPEKSMDQDPIYISYDATHREKSMSESEMNLDEAKTVVENEKKARADACATKLKEMLEEHQCTLDVKMLQDIRGNHPLVTVVSL